MKRSISNLYSPSGVIPEKNNINTNGRDPAISSEPSDKISKRVLAAKQRLRSGSPVTSAKQRLRSGSPVTSEESVCSKTTVFWSKTIDPKSNPPEEQDLNETADIRTGSRKRLGHAIPIRTEQIFETLPRLSGD